MIQEGRVLEFFETKITDEGILAFVGNESADDSNIYIICGVGIGANEAEALSAARRSSADWFGVCETDITLHIAPKGIKWTAYEARN